MTDLKQETSSQTHPRDFFALEGLDYSFGVEQVQAPVLTTQKKTGERNEKKKLDRLS